MINADNLDFKNVCDGNLEVLEIERLEEDEYIPADNNGYLPIPTEEQKSILSLRRSNIVIELQEREMTRPQHNIDRNNI